MTSILKHQGSYERRDQYNSLGMPINSLWQLVTALGYITSSEHSGDPCDVIFGRKKGEPRDYTQISSFYD